jgi:tetratricopeptide (TPR) repeat protein
MKTAKLFFLSGILLFIVSCSNNEPAETNVTAPKPEARQVFLNQIKKYESEMHKSLSLDPSLANITVTAYDNFVKNFPDDSLDADFLFKAGEISTANQQYKQALIYYETITKKYADYKYAPESLYLQGYLLDNFLNDDAKAKIIYEEVIVKYPSLPYAKDAKAAINNLGKSDEDLIKEFEKKNKGK